MTRLRLGITAVLALLSGACSDGGAGAKATSGGTGGSSATRDGGVLSADSGSSADGAAPNCDGTQTDDPQFSLAMKALRDELTKHAVPGGAIAIIKDGKLVNLGVAGSKRQATCDPITPDTLFGAGMATWLVTTLAVLSAVEEGKLSLTAPITNYVPTLSVSNGDASQITLHHVLSNSSMYSKDPIGGAGSPDCAGLADSFTNAKNPVLGAKPGSMHNWGHFELAGLALENVDKKPFADAARDRVLQPLAMGGAFDTATILASDHSFGHADLDESRPQQDCRNHDPGDGYFGSIRDFAKIAAYLTGGAGQVVSPAMRDAMLSDQGLHFFSSFRAFYGGDSYAFQSGDTLVSDDGGGAGFTEMVAIYKERHLAVITLMNSTSGEPWTVSMGVGPIYDPSIKGPRMLIGYDPLKEAIASPYTPTPASLASVIGTYKDALGFHGTGPRTLKVFLDPADSGKLAGTLSGVGGTSDSVAFLGMCCADNFTLVNGPNAYWARFWRDDAGNGSAISFLGDSGPPFFRAP